MKAAQSEQMSVGTLYLRLVNSYSSFKTQLRINPWNFQCHLPPLPIECIILSMLPLSVRNTVIFLIIILCYCFLKYMNTQQRKSQLPFPHFSLSSSETILCLGCILQGLYIQKYIGALHKLNHTLYIVLQAIFS